MGAVLAEVSERVEREGFFAEARHQLNQLWEHDEAAWSADREESRSWLEGADRDTLRTQDEPGWWE